VGNGVLAELSDGDQPVTTAEMKLHMREDLSDTDNNSLIDSYISAAVDWVESFTGLPLTSATYAYYLEEFPTDGSDIILPRCPVVTLTQIAYIDAAGTSQVLSAANYDVQNKTGRIRPAYGQSWPTTQSVLDAVTISFTAGHGSANAVPNVLKLAVKMLVAHWYEHRLAVSEVDSRSTQVEVPLGVRNLLWPYRMVRFT
jgi:uncharacterized phiE125 gp8 family phage protein